jgi:hypothetical protein
MSRISADRGLYQWLRIIGSLALFASAFTVAMAGGYLDAKDPTPNDYFASDFQVTFPSSTPLVADFGDNPINSAAYELDALISPGTYLGEFTLCQYKPAGLFGSPVGVRGQADADVRCLSGCAALAVRPRASNDHCASATTASSARSGSGGSPGASAAYRPAGRRAARQDSVKLPPRPRGGAADPSPVKDRP